MKYSFLILLLGLVAAALSAQATDNERVFEGAFCINEGERHYEHVAENVYDVFYCSAGAWRFLMRQDNTEN